MDGGGDEAGRGRQSTKWVIFAVTCSTWSRTASSFSISSRGRPARTLRNLNPSTNRSIPSSLPNSLKIVGPTQWKWQCGQASDHRPVDCPLMLQKLSPSLDPTRVSELLDILAGDKAIAGEPAPSFDSFGPIANRLLDDGPWRLPEDRAAEAIHHNREQSRSRAYALRAARVQTAEAGGSGSWTRLFEVAH